MDLKAIASVLNRDDVRSRVMKDGAYFDSCIGIILGIYLTSEERYRHLHELIIDRLKGKKGSSPLLALDTPEGERCRGKLPGLSY